MGTKQLFRTNDALVTLVSNFNHGFSEFSWHYYSLTMKNKTVGHSQFIKKILEYALMPRSLWSIFFSRMHVINLCSSSSFSVAFTSSSLLITRRMSLATTKFTYCLASLVVPSSLLVQFSRGSGCLDVKSEIFVFQGRYSTLNS